MNRGVHTPIVVDSAKLRPTPSKNLFSYSDDEDKDWRYSLSNDGVTYTRVMSINFNLITGFDPWGRKFVKSIFYNQSRTPDKLATWRLFYSMANKVYGKTFTAYGYTTVGGEVTKLRVTNVDSNDFMFISPHYVLYGEDFKTPLYIV